MRRRVFAALVASVLAVACGKKGPPLPPLVRLPAAPQDLVGARQGDTVNLLVKVPEGNVDGVTPADITRLDIYALTGLPTVPTQDVVRRGTRVASVPINPPPDPDLPEGEEQPDRKVPGGVDQGATALLHDTVAPAAGTEDVRVYVAVGVNRRGRRGTPSASLAVPLVPAPPAPPSPALTYDDKAVTLTWPADADGVHVYLTGEPERRLSRQPVSDGSFVDERMVFDAERCYVTRRATRVGGATLESEASPPACVTPRDTFAPPAPTGLNAVPEVAAVSLIWNPVDANDLAGYVVLRAVGAAGALEPITPDPITDTTYRDAVPSGSRVRYAVQAVDQRGNRSEPSATIEETVR